MKFDPEIHHRRSIRLRDYDYSANGAYFVTVCMQGRECLFGEVVEGLMVPNEAGRMVTAVWNALPVHYPGVDVDVHVIMPNHFHGIIMLHVEAGPHAYPDIDCTINVGAAPRGRPKNGHMSENGHPQGGAPTLTLPDVVHRFKSLTTAHYRHGVTHHNWPSFPGRLWQRNYYERVIRNDDELNGARKYIAENPMKWAQDKENPANVR